MRSFTYEYGMCSYRLLEYFTKKNFDPEKLLDLQIQNIYKITIKKNMDIVNNNNDIKK